MELIHFFYSLQIWVKRQEIISNLGYRLVLGIVSEVKKMDRCPEIIHSYTIMTNMENGPHLINAHTRYTVVLMSLYPLAECGPYRDETIHSSCCLYDCGWVLKVVRLFFFNWGASQVSLLTGRILFICLWSQLSLYLNLPHNDKILQGICHCTKLKYSQMYTEPTENGFFISFNFVLILKTK